MIGQMGGLFMGALVLLLIILVLSSRLRPAMRWLTAVGLVMRVAGVATMLAIIFGFYQGIADAVGYFNVASQYAERMAAGDFRMFSDRSEWAGGQWWGSQFVYFFSTPVVAVLGPGLFGPFLLFSLLSFAGLCLFVAAFARTYPDVPLSNYARWLFLFPSLWLWPSVIGKEALILLGVGLLAYGYFRRGRVAWLPTLSGVLLIFAVRPQVAAVVVFSVTLAEWIRREGRWTVLRAVQGVAIVGLGMFIITTGLSLVAEQAGVSGVEEYLELRAERAEVGGSAVEGTEVGIAGIPQGILNTLFRPFPWEARNPMALASSLEIWILWAVALFRWRRVAAAIREWRSTRFMAMGLPFVLIYAATFGMVVVNLGIIARQRIFLFPFLFAILEASPELARQRRRTRPVVEARRPAPRLVQERAL